MQPYNSETSQGCDVSSDTGSGVVGEGAELRVVRCRVHDCHTHGVAIYGDLLGEFGGGVVDGCEKQNLRPYTPKP